MLEFRVFPKITTLGVEKDNGMNTTFPLHGNTKNKQQISLCKRNYEHRDSGGHKAALEINKVAKKDTLVEAYAKVVAHEVETTTIVFRTAYYRLS